MTSLVLDTSTLKPGAKGAQTNSGKTVASFHQLGPPIQLFLFEDLATGEQFFADPQKLAAGELALHPYLLAEAKYGGVFDKDEIVQQVKDELRLKVAQFELKAAGAVSGALQAVATGQQTIGQAVAALEAHLTKDGGALAAEAKIALDAIKGAASGVDVKALAEQAVEASLKAIVLP